MRQQIPLSKIKGREDNLMYKISDGFNLEDNDKTFFDKFNVMELLSASKSMNLSNLLMKNTDGINKYKNSNSAMNIINQQTKKHYAAQRHDDTDRISSNNEE